MILPKCKSYIFSTEIGKFGPIRIASLGTTGTLLSLIVPPRNRSIILMLINAPLIQKAAENHFPTYAESVSQQFGRCLGSLKMSHRHFKSMFGNKKIGRKAVTEDFDLAIITDETLDVAVSDFINPARVKDQVCQFMEKGENLTCFC